jgi:hypothetical protein
MASESSSQILITRLFWPLGSALIPLLGALHLVAPMMATLLSFQAPRLLLDADAVTHKPYLSSVAIVSDCFNALEIKPTTNHFGLPPLAAEA